MTKWADGFHGATGGQDLKKIIFLLVQDRRATALYILDMFMRSASGVTNYSGRMEEHALKEIYFRWLKYQREA
jgi:hypothetical protein